MNERGPHLPGGVYSPLNALITQALTRYGSFASGQMDADAALTFLHFANEIVDDVNQHPYRTGFPPIDYYLSLQDIRPIDDTIIVHGLMAKYAIQQRSEAAGLNDNLYNRTMAARLYYAVAGNSPIRVRPVDGGSNRASSAKTNPYTGMPE